MLSIKSVNGCSGLDLHKPLVSSGDHAERFTTIVSILAHRGLHHANQPAYSFLNSDLQVHQHLSYGMLWSKASHIARQLIALQEQGQPVLLVFDAGLEFVAAYMACLVAGMVAVPVCSPRHSGTTHKLRAIAQDCHACVLLSSVDLLRWMRQQATVDDVITHCQLIEVDLDQTTADDSPQEPYVSDMAYRPDTLAMLQYTSGSTGLPKGVMLRHAQLMANLEAIRSVMRPRSGDCGVIWLPAHHDMGLIGGILQPLFSGLHFYLMAPSAFLQRPVRWLQAISLYKASITAAPDFAFQLCTDRVSEEIVAALDLSSLEVVFNGAEPIRAETLLRFEDKFSSAGFKSSAWLPCYGLAEATLMVSGLKRGSGRVIKHVSKDALAVGAMCQVCPTQNDAITLTSVGSPAGANAVKIVDPLTLSACMEGQVGEVWVSGQTVAAGYWQQQEQTAQTFVVDSAPSMGNCNLSGDAIWLRTGDLGTLYDKQLWITGRLKDLIIIRGQNHYPQDIESTVNQLIVKSGGRCSVAFAAVIDGQESLVVVAEVHRHTPSHTLAVLELEVRAAVSKQHQLMLHELFFVARGTLPKTTSGKLQRQLTRAQWHNQQLVNIRFVHRVVSNRL